MKKLPQKLFLGILLSIILTQSALCQTAYLNQFQYSSINDLTLSRVTQVIGNSGLQVVAGGHKTPNEEQVTEPFIAQLNPNGTVQWFFNLIPQGYGANTNFYITSIIATVDGSGNPNGYLVSLFFDTAPWKSIFIHRTLSGGSDWQKVLDIGPNNMMPVTSVIQCSQANNYSYAFTAFTGNPRVLVLGKLDVTGTSITLRKYGNSAFSQEPPYVIKENASTGNFVASYTANDTAAGIRRLHLLELGSGN